MLTDLEIAQQAKILNIKEIAKKVNLSEDDLELYGKYKAKIHLDKLSSDKKDAKLILVTAINPTPAGEGKSTTTIGLADAMNKIGKKTVVALREPSFGPVMGVKGGAAGGGGNGGGDGNDGGGLSWWWLLGGNGAFSSHSVFWGT